jgi:CheY-like chemotaxis protein
MSVPDSEMRSSATTAIGRLDERGRHKETTPFSLHVKLFAALAVVVLIGLVGLVELALRQHRDLAFESLKRDGANFVSGVALSNPEVMLDGDPSAFREIASDLMRRPELQFIRFESPQNADPIMVTRAGFSPPSISARTLPVEVSSTRLVHREDELLLEVIVPLSTVVSAIHMEVDADGTHLVPVSGALTMGIDATQTQVALLASAQRLRMAQAAIAVFILVGLWISIRKALAPFESLADAAQRIGAGEVAVELPQAATNEAHQLTLGLAAIQKLLKPAAADRRPVRSQPSRWLESDRKDLDGSQKADRGARGLRSPGERPTLADRVRSPRGAHHILLVEDNPVNRSVAVGMLEALDCTIVCAEDGVASLAALEAEPFDLVFMDIQMPRMDGHEATRRIRAAEERIGASPTPIVALTAHSQVEDRAASAKAGMNGHISKPFTREDLRQALQQWCASDKSGDVDEG